MQIRVLGIGMGLNQITPEVAAALSTADYVIASDKGDDDSLLSLRREIAEAFSLPLLAVPDPARDRSPDDYRRAVADWHDARVEAFAGALRERGGVAAFLVWGDPALYDSTIRVVQQIAARLGADYDVLPGVSAPQLLAARHRIVLHEIGMPVLITTGRRLPEALAGGHRNIVVMLATASHLPDLDDWSIWWGANLGTPGEELLAGTVGESSAKLAEAAERARRSCGWLMEVFLLRAPQ